MHIVNIVIELLISEKYCFSEVISVTWFAKN